MKLIIMSISFTEYSKNRIRTETTDKNIVQEMNHAHFDFMRSMDEIGLKDCTYGKLLNWSLGIAGESGELVDVLKKILFHGHPVNRDSLIEELGDILWYIDAIASSIGSSLEEIAEFNVDKLKKRYPEGFSFDKSVNRDKNTE